MSPAPLLRVVQLHLQGAVAAVSVHLALQLLLLSAVSATSAPRIPLNMSQWVGIPPPTDPGHQRMHGPDMKWAVLAKQKKPVKLEQFWDRSMLQHGRIVENFEQARPLLDKLNAGQPIVVAAFGDSITGGYGGCFQAEGFEELLLRQGARLMAKPHGHMHEGDCNVFPVSWLNVFMKQINTSWPHKDHVLINLGGSGNTYHYYAEGNCWEEYLPHHVDLVILEHLPHLEMQEAMVMEAERLLHRLMLHQQGPLPTVIMLATTTVLHPLRGEEYQDHNATMCLLTPVHCNTLCPTQFIDRPPREWLFSRAEMDTHAVAAYYGLASLSYTAMVYALMRDEVPQRRLKLSECEALSLLFCDQVHPDMFGRLLMANMLVDYLSRAEAYLADPATRTIGARNGRSATLLPQHPIKPGSLSVYKAQCLYAGPLEPDGTSSDRKGSGGSESGRLDSHGSRADGSDSSSGQGSGAAGRSKRQSLPVIKSQGWSYVEMEGQGDKVKYKPGMVANSSGAVMWIDLPLDHAVATPESSEGGVDAHPTHGTRGLDLGVHITYLVSYKHMGKAQVSCLEACSCRQMVIDGHHTSPYSLPFIHNAGAHLTDTKGRCILEFKVLNESSSGEHKFKLIHLAVGATVNMTQQLRDIVKRARQAV